MFSSLPLCFHIFRCFLSWIPMFGAKDIPTVNSTNLTWSWFSFLNTLHSYQNRNDKKNPLSEFFSKKGSFRKTYSGQLLHLSDSAVFADFANLCSLSMMLFTYPSLLFHTESKYWELITCAWLGAHDMAVHKATAPALRSNGWLAKQGHQTRRNNMITVPVIALIH